MEVKNKKRFYTNKGEKFAYRYIRHLDKNGEPKMVLNEKFNLYEDIQSYAEDCNIERIISKLGGDISQLDTNKGVYMDVTLIPDNYNDFCNAVSDIASDYSKLPIKYKNALKNNFNLYYGLAMSGKAKDFINSITIDDVDTAKSMLNSKNFDFGNNPIKPTDKNDNNVSDDGGNKNV